MWWNEQKINFYERAAKQSSFHKDLASILTPLLDKGARIIEYGCGLGFLTKELSILGFNIIGCDIEELPISFAKTNFSDCKFYLGDCYDLKETYDIGICCFFGRIMEDDNLYKLLRNVKKLIYIENEHSSTNFFRSMEIERFLIKKGLDYSLTTTQLSFNQPLKENEKQSFIDTYYSSFNLEFKAQNDSNFPLIAIKNKNLGIFCIQRKN